jgi:hypothetical protein
VPKRHNSASSIIFILLLSVMLPVFLPAKAAAPYNSMNQTPAATSMSDMDGGWFTITENGQTHGLWNNVWNNPFNEPHTEYVQASTTSSTFSAGAGWNWTIANPTGDTYSYPNIWQGVGLGPGLVDTDNRFPFLVGSYGSLSTNIPQVQVSATGSWALAFDIFLFHDSSSFGQSNVQAEIFIILKMGGSYAHPPSTLGHVPSAGVTYSYGVWSKSPSEAIFWRTDNPTSPFSQAIDIYDFINYLVKLGKAQTTNVLAMVALGVEPIQGSGTFTVDSYYWTLGTGPTTTTISTSTQTTQSSTSTQTSGKTSTSTQTSSTRSTSSTSSTASTSSSSTRSTQLTTSQVSMPIITLTPSSASAGSTIHVLGSGFSTADVVCSFSGSAVSASSCSISNGMLTGSFNVAGVSPGYYLITAIGSPGGDSASVTLNLNAPRITLNPSSGPVGATISVAGIGFSLTDTACTIGGGSIASSTCTISGGALAGTFLVSNVTAAIYAVTATGNPAGDSAVASFQLTAASPSVTLNPTSAKAGATVTVSGSGFATTDTTCLIEGSSGSISTSTCTISAGTLAGSFVVANATAATYAIKVTGSQVGDWALAALTIDPSSTETTTTQSHTSIPSSSTTALPEQTISSTHSVAVTTVTASQTPATSQSASSTQIVSPQTMPPIPGFPSASIVIGMILGAVVLALIRRRRAES